MRFLLSTEHLRMLAKKEELRCPPNAAIKVKKILSINTQNASTAI